MIWDLSLKRKAGLQLSLYLSGTTCFPWTSQGGNDIHIHWTERILSPSLPLWLLCIRPMLIYLSINLLLLKTELGAEDNYLPLLLLLFTCGCLDGLWWVRSFWAVSLCIYIRRSVIHEAQGRLTWNLYFMSEMARLSTPQCSFSASSPSLLLIPGFRLPVCLQTWFSDYLSADQTESLSNGFNYFFLTLFFNFCHPSGSVCSASPTF